MSRRVMSTFGSHALDIEIYSINEAFLSLDGFQHFQIALFYKAPSLKKGGAFFLWYYFHNSSARNRTSVIEWRPLSAAPV